MASKIPYNNIFDVLKAGRDAGKSADETVSVLILLGDDADRSHIDALHGAFLAERAGGLVSVRPLSDPTAPDAPYDIAVIASGTDTEDLMRAVDQLASHATPCAILVRSAVCGYDFSHLGYQDYEPEVIAAADGETLLEKLATWIIGASEKGRAFAANFSFVRPAEIRALITACAIQNATVGAINLIPGSDLPIMTANQAKLALDIAAAYGKGLTLSRVPEVAGVIGAGFAYRALARALLGLIPGVGWALRAGLGYAGTVATGNAIKARFESENRLGRSAETALAMRPQADRTPSGVLERQG